MKELQKLEASINHLVQCFKDFSITFTRYVTKIDELEDMMNRLNMEAQQLK